VNREFGDRHGRVYAPMTPDEVDALADHVDRHYGETADGKHPIVAELKAAAARFRR
jgi:hypothetical protein